jgi:peptidyl-prolyl cis-trans isomerase B (cyclophilin B)
VAGLAVWQFVFNKSSKPSSTAASTTSSVAPTQDTATPAQAGVLPPFKPPADLGANCQYQPTPAEPAAEPVKPPRTGKIPTDPAVVSVSMMTNFGPIGIKLDNAKAPCTVNNFASLAGQRFFDNTRCHRETNDPNLSILQCGDANATKPGYPEATGEGGPGYQFANEYPTNQYLPDDPALAQSIIYPRGALAMANTGKPGTNGSQFFMVMRDSKLPPNYTIFGTIDKTGLATLDKIAAAGVVPSGDTTKPAQDVMITSVRLD